VIGAGLVSRLTVTPLLWAIGILLVALAASSGYAYVLRADVVAAQAATAVAIAERDGARLERDTATTRGLEVANSARGWEAVAGERLTLLNACQTAAVTIREAGEQAVRNARAAARDAERTLDAFTKRYQVEARRPDCERARHAMAAACPALEDY
jgi:hypothetical protein